jgi:hypothetical protein
MAWASLAARAEIAGGTPRSLAFDFGDPAAGR